MPTTIAVANAKGGVGKTTTAAAISAIFASKGARVLMADLDIQANLTYSTVKTTNYKGPFLYDVIPTRGCPPRLNVAKNLDIIPSGLEMTGVERTMYNMCRREYIIQDIVSQVADDYDIIVLDCPPALSLITMNALAFTDRLLVPLMADRLSFLGLQEITSYAQGEVALLRKRQPEVDVFLTMHETVTKVSRAWEEAIRNELGETVMKTTIRKDTKLREAASTSTLITEYAPESKSVEDYTYLVKELYDRITKQKEEENERLQD